MIVTPTDFDTLPYVLPNIPQNLPKYQRFIDAQEAEVLELLLGLPFYEAFKAGLNAEPVEPRWADLRDGVLYLDSASRKYLWPGMKKFLVPYIYAQWVQLATDDLTELGNTVSNTENAEQADPVLRIVQAWNAANKVLGGQCVFNGHINTLYGYLFNSGTTYDDDVTGWGYPTFAQYLPSHYQAIGRKNEFGF